MLNRTIHFFCRIYARIKAKSVYPDKIEMDFSALLSAAPSLKIAVIDNEEFIFIPALEAKGHRVTQYTSYTKPIKSPKQRLTPHDLSKYDIILCDIHDIGTELYGNSEGISVITDLREKHPLHVIAAYTGDPGAIVRNLKKTTAVDKIFSRDWEVEDFLLNFQDLSDIFYRPKQRWRFLQKRMEHLDVSESKLTTLREAFVENILVSQILREKFRLSTSQIYNLISKTDNRLDIGMLSNYGITAVKMGSVLSPFIDGA
ncbi:hypothetical protein [Pseudomonas lopnurensis]|uniref:hypothetical protein n=1 Tax=Pseudomonas lopnurensis TaxID=1477517 RepID=UPI001879055B|nr:hypothetical protein [Pseudomonas lopnurensis]MBE7374586.1 hypothetical protein [Pseudomonas lopnurensis]